MSSVDTLVGADRNSRTYLSIRNPPEQRSRKDVPKKVGRVASAAEVKEATAERRAAACSVCTEARYNSLTMYERPRSWNAKWRKNEAKSISLSERAAYQRVGLVEWMKVINSCHPKFQR